MTSAIVLPPLDIWAKERLISLIQAKTQTDFDAAFDSFIAHDAGIIFNGVKISRDEYKKQLQGERVLEASATVDITEIVVAPVFKSETTDTQNSGLVGLFFNATYFETIRVMAAAEEHKQQSALNIRVEQIGPVPVQTPHTVGGGADRRRVVELAQISTDISVPPNLPTPIPPVKA